MLKDPGNTVKTRLRALFKRAGDYPPIKAALTMGGHRELSLVQVFRSTLILHFTRRLRKVEFLSAYVGGLFIKHRQKLLRHPSVVANLHDTGLQTMYICITYHCNRNCSFCYSKGLQEEFKEHMSLANFEFAARWAKAQGWKRLRLLGGEPTFHPEFNAILSLAGQLGFAVTFSTNGLYGPGLELSRDVVESISFSYPQEDLRPGEMDAFHRNLNGAITAGIPVTLSWVVQPDSDGWRRVIDLAKDCQGRAVARFSMLLPGHRQTIGAKEFKDQLKGLAGQILDIARYACEKHVMFFFYRPFLRCMFTPEQLALLRSISPFLFYTRCPLCLRGEYDSDLRLTINPDLTCYPCPAVSAKGIKLTPDATRESVNKLFAPLMREITVQPLMDSCRDCRFYADYKGHLEDTVQDLADKTVCQGGCFQYRQCKSDCTSGVC